MGALRRSDVVDVEDLVGEGRGVLERALDGRLSGVDALGGGLEGGDVLLGSGDVVVEGLLEVGEEGGLVLVLFLDFLKSVSDVLNEGLDESSDGLSDVGLGGSLSHDFDEVGEDGAHSDEFGIGGFDLESDFGEGGVVVLRELDESGTLGSSAGGEGGSEDGGDLVEVGGDGVVVGGPGVLVVSDVGLELSVVVEFFRGSLEEASVDLGGSFDELKSSLQLELSVFVLSVELLELLKVGDAATFKGFVVLEGGGLLGLDSLVVGVQEVSEGSGV